MGHTLVTQADRQRTPAPTPAQGHSRARSGNGQQVSRERGTATRNKKQTGKRPHQGG